MGLKLLNRANKINKYIICLVMFLIIYYLVEYFNHKNTPVEYLPKHLHKYVISFKDRDATNSAATKTGSLQEKIEKMSETRMVQNWQIYGPVSAATTIIVVRVHRDLERLQYLIVSLTFVHEIENALLIFSHTYYDENINYLIQNIDFCMVLQIFYPQSLQLYPNYYQMRGSDTNVSYEYARQAESKNHWWWTAHVVFEQLAWADIHEDMVIFIDEDTYVLPDLLHMLRLSKLSLAYVDDAGVISFGRSLAKDLEYDKLTVEAWRPPHDIGLAFNKTTWRKIVALKIHYCLYDDSSWSYSLLHLFNQFPRRFMVMAACMAPRIVPTGLFDSGRQAFETIWRLTKCDQLFPKKVQAVMLYGHIGRLINRHKMPPKGNGGWREILQSFAFCLDPLMVTATVDDSTSTSPIFSTETRLTTDLISS